MAYIPYVPYDQAVGLLTSPSPGGRMRREMIAVAFSAANDCFH